MIVTDVFEGSARQILKSLGYPDIPVLATPNPVTHLSKSEIHERLDGLLDKLVESLRDSRSQVS